MDVATAALQARLDQQGGTPAEWQLLAQSYDFLGRPVEAAAARAHLDTAGKADWPDAAAAAALTSPAPQQEEPIPKADAPAASSKSRLSDRTSRDDGPK
jgi:hypothetical protein